jgi:hypothetical protein
MIHSMAWIPNVYHFPPPSSPLSFLLSTSIVLPWRSILYQQKGAYLLKHLHQTSPHLISSKIDLFSPPWCLRVKALALSSSGGAFPNPIEPVSNGLIYIVMQGHQKFIGIIFKDQICVYIYIQLEQNLWIASTYMWRFRVGLSMSLGNIL